MGKMSEQRKMKKVSEIKVHVWRSDLLSKKQNASRWRIYNDMETNIIYSRETKQSKGHAFNSNSVVYICTLVNVHQCPPRK